jgi:S1-C subfamily serine protease
MRSFALMIGVLTFTAGAAAQQPAPTPKASTENSKYYFSRSDDNGDRAMIGVGTSSTGKRDTLGLMITSVTYNGPAEKAGIVEGDRLVSVNGTSLKVAAGDAGEPEMNGLMTRRLVRALSSVKAGDEVTFVVYSNGSTKTVKVKTVARDDMEGSRKVNSERAAVGLNFGGNGSLRDTLGIFVQSVTKDGPADKAGIEEGNRVASINGVDMRVPAADAEDGSLGWAKQERFTRVLMGLKPGDVVELKVWANGAYKTVKVTTVKASDIYGKLGAEWREYGQAMAGYARMAPMAPMPPMPPMPAIAPMVRMPMNFGWSDGSGSGSSTMTCVSQGDGNMQCRSTPSARSRNRVTVVTPDGDAMHEREMARAKGGRTYYSKTDDDGNAEINFPGLRLTSVTPELAAYFGAGSEKGLLVLEASDEWTPLKTGDVVLKLNGRPVVRGQTSSMSLESDEDNTFSVIRKQKTISVTVKAH